MTKYNYNVQCTAVLTGGNPLKFQGGLTSMLSGRLRSYNTKERRGLIDFCYANPSQAPPNFRQCVQIKLYEIKEFFRVLHVFGNSNTRIKI